MKGKRGEKEETLKRSEERGGTKTERGKNVSPSYLFCFLSLSYFLFFFLSHVTPNCFNLHPVKQHKLTVYLPLY